VTKASLESRSSEEFWIFGIHIARKTDILAFAAFLIALGGIVFQVSGFLRGPVLRIFPPPQIVIRKAALTSGRTPVRFAALVAYVNDGDSGYNATVRSELLHYRLSGRTYTQIWQEFTASDVDPDGTINMHPQGVALPLVINAGSSASHETYFTPLPLRISKNNPDEWANFLEWDQFLEDLKSVTSMTFELEAQVYGHKSVSSRCVIDIDAEVINRLKRTNWYAPPCWQIS
jgi:hypothetical protein